MKIIQLITTVSLVVIIVFMTNCKKSPVKVDNAESNNAIENEISIHEASLNGQYEAVLQILDAENTNVNARDQEGRTALMYASFNGHYEIAVALIERGADIHLQDLYGRTALMFASTGPYTETVKLLLDHDADPNVTDAEEHYTALMYAAAEGQLEVVRILLDNNADPAMLDADGDDAENFARNNGHVEVAELLAGVKQ